MNVSKCGILTHLCSHTGIFLRIICPFWEKKWENYGKNVTFCHDFSQCITHFCSMLDVPGRFRLYSIYHPCKIHDYPIWETLSIISNKIFCLNTILLWSIGLHKFWTFIVCTLENVMEDVPILTIEIPILTIKMQIFSWFFPVGYCKFTEPWTWLTYFKLLGYFFLDTN